ncbi:MAG: ketoacyl-ACP synthase III [Actinophytocola sp.]|uniref:ketoacyl-ACP synthase III n=1 Tax=Actinophytocola sp. TaxID=1872138 RepID=UPI003C78C4FA
MREGIWAGSGIRLAGFGHHYPHRHVTCEPEQAAEFGVRGRHVADDDETVATMAANAVRRALDAAGLPATDLDLLLLANCTTRRYFPEAAPRVALELGADRALAFDVCGACAGFVLGVHLAASLLTTSQSRCAAVVASEQFSRRTRPGSRSSLVVGDAAGAVILTRNLSTAPGLLDSLVRTHADEHEVCVIRPSDGWLKAQPRVVELALATQFRAIDDLLDRNDLKLDDVDWIVPHPGTRHVHTTLRDELARRGKAVVTNFESCGNTASATIPTTLSEQITSGRFQPGQLVLAPTAGAGWYSGGLLFRV